MRNYIIYVFFLIIILNCHSPTATEDLSENINFLTDKDFYTFNDSINVLLQNNSNKDIIFSLRCGRYLEMSYQEKENGAWSEDKSFWWMSLKCFSDIDTLSQNTSTNFSFNSNTFNKTGTFRLSIKLQTPNGVLAITKFSNSFEIK